MAKEGVKQKSSKRVTEFNYEDLYEDSMKFSKQCPLKGVFITTHL